MPFLDKNGLSILWGNITSKFATKEELSSIDVQDEIYIGDGELPEGYTLQINPEGDVMTIVNLPTPTTEDSGKILQVDSTGAYSLETLTNAEEITVDNEVTQDGQNAVSGAAVWSFVAEHVPDTVPADNVTAGTFAGAVKANAASGALEEAQIRNSVIVSTDPGDGAEVSYPAGTLVIYA